MNKNFNFLPSQYKKNNSKINHNYLSSQFSDYKKILNKISKVVKRNDFTLGEEVNKFERNISKLIGAKHVLAVGSGTDAIMLSLKCLGVEKGDEVITTPFTFYATIGAIVTSGAKPVFVDVKDDYNIDPDLIEKKITKKTKAIIIVHMAGFACQIDLIQKICKKYKIKLIEDCAHSVGTKFKSIHVGNFGVSGCFSFYPTKQITTGEGGMLVTNNKSFYNKIRKLKAFGIDKDINQRTKQGTYDVVSLGFNYRLTDFQSALGLKQIGNYKENLKKRHLLAKKYTKGLQNIQQVRCMPYSSDCSFFVFQIFCKDRDKLLKEFKIKKIGVSIHYATPLPSMTYYKKKYNFKKINFKNAKNYADTNISLPIYPSLNFKELNKIVEVINKFYEHSK